MMAALAPCAAALPPALKALAAQLAGLLTAFVLGRSGMLPAGLWPLVATQAIAATLTAAVLGSARWWLVIHLAFLPLLVAAQRLDLPPQGYLLAFIALAAFYWSGFRTQAPLFLTNRRTVEAMARLLPADRSLRVLDIGSGTGSLLRPLARRRPDSRFDGIEAAPAPWLIGRLLGCRLPNLHWRRGDLFAADWRAYDVVYAFLSPAPMAAVWRKACAEMAPGSLLLSNSFAIPDCSAEFVIDIGDRRRTRLFGYRIPAREERN